MSNKVVINVKNNINRFIKKCIQYKIDIAEIDYKNDDELSCTINLKDYKTIKRLNYYSNIKIIKYNGVKGIKVHFKKYIYFYVLILFCFILMDIITSYIIDISVIHENSRIRSLVMKELENHGIKKYTLAYSFEELDKIKNDILKDNPMHLEWMSITRVGMKYIIRVEERIIKDKEEKNKPRNIIASKDALITKVTAISGEPIIRSGDYVKKGDILISGNIYLYDEVKGKVPATGTVYGNVWYESKVKIPKETEVISDTGKKRYNININNKIFLKNKYHLFRQENIRELNILGLKIKIYKEVEYKKTTTKLSSKELDKLAENKIKLSFEQKLKGNGNIVSQKVLKKIEKNSTIEYRIFVITNEVISEYSYLPEGDENDTAKSY